MVRSLLSLIIALAVALPAAAQHANVGSGAGGGVTLPIDVTSGGTGNNTGAGLVARCTDSVGTDAYACSSTTTPACPASLAASLPVLFQAGTANTGAATFAYCGFAAKALVKTVGGISTTLADNDILAKQTVLAIYNSVDDNFKMISAVSNNPTVSLIANSTPITSGTDKYCLFQDGSVVGEDAGCSYDKTTDSLTLVGSSFVGSGAVGTPSYSFTAGNTTGMWWDNGNSRLAFSKSASLAFVIDSSATTNGIAERSDGAIGFLNGTTTGTTLDTYMQRQAAGIFRFHQLALTASTMTAGNTGAQRTSTHSYTWSNAQVAALGAVTTGDINVVTLPAKTQVERALVVITGAAVGPTTVTVSCGDATVGAPFTNYVLAGDAKAAANTVYGDAISGAETGASLFDATAKWIPAFLPSYTATTLVTCRFISTGANLSTVTGSTGTVILQTTVLP